MSEVERISDQLRRSHQGSAWHGPSLLEVLDGVTDEQANRRVLPNAHTIWELVLHLTAWEQVVTRRLAGETVPDLPPDQDFPAVADATGDGWKSALDQMNQAQRQLAQSIAQLTDDGLKRMVAGKDYSVYFMLHGAIQHKLYHAGQIAVFKKSLAPPTPAPDRSAT